MDLIKKGGGHYRKRLLWIVLFMMVGMYGTPEHIWGSIFPAPGATPEDGALSANVVALPLDGVMKKDPNLFRAKGE